MAFLPMNRRYPLPGILDARARNGQVPHGQSVRDSLHAQMWAVTHCRKLLFATAPWPELDPRAGASETVLYTFQIETGLAINAAGTVDIVVSAAVGPSDNGAATDPRWRVKVSDSSLSSVVNSGYQRFPAVNASVDASGFATQEIRVTGLSPSTHYVVEVAGTDYIVIAGVTGWEQVERQPDTAATYITDYRSIGARTKILDADASAARANSKAAWEASGAILCNLTPAEVPYSTTSSSYQNVFDAAASTTVGANTPGVNLNVQYHNSANTTNVPVKIAVVGKAVTGTGGDLIVANSSGTLATLSSFTTSDTVKTATFNLDGSAALNKLDFQFRISGAATQLQIRSIAIWEDD